MTPTQRQVLEAAAEGRLLVWRGYYGHGVRYWIRPHNCPDTRRVTVRRSTIEVARRNGWLAPVDAQQGKHIAVPLTAGGREALQ